MGRSRGALALVALGAVLAMAAPADAASFTAAAPMSAARGFPAAAPLPGGEALFAGGDVVVGGFANATNEADIYNVASDTWRTVQPMNAARDFPAAAPLADGRVLVVGGTTLSGGERADGEIYDPSADSWTTTASMSTARYAAIAAPLPGGDILVAGGENGSVVFNSAEIFHPATGTWTSAATMPTGHAVAAAGALPDGRVVVAGGDRQPGVKTAAVEIFTPDPGGGPGSWAPAAPLSAASTWLFGTGIDGGALVFGGFSAGGPFVNLHLFRDPLSVHTKWLTAPTLLAPRVGAGVAATGGAVVVAGGRDGGTLNFLASAEVLKPGEASVSPASPFDFGDVSVQSSAMQSFTVTNTGAGPLAIGTVMPNGAGFSKVSASCAGATLPPGGQCEVVAKFAPTSPGAKAGTIKLSDDSLAGRDVISMTGNGVGPKVSIAPGSSFDFGSVPVGSTSDPQTFTVSNGGNADLHVSKVAINGTGFTVMNETCTQGAVAPSGSCSVTVTFRPTSAGAKSATVKLTDDAHAGYDLIHVSGSGAIT